MTGRFFFQFIDELNAKMFTQQFKNFMFLKRFTNTIVVTGFERFGAFLPITDYVPQYSYIVDVLSYIRIV